ncbi:MAG: hypothetical protein V1853_00720 [bacterium]
MILVSTAGATLVIALIGIIIPFAIYGLGGFLINVLLVSVMVRLRQIVIAFTIFDGSIWYMKYIEYGAVLLLTLYIVNNWKRAMNLPRTIENAMDCALANLLDVFNLIYTLLRFTGSRITSLVRR